MTRNAFTVAVVGVPDGTAGVTVSDPAAVGPTTPIVPVIATASAGMPLAPATDNVWETFAEKRPSGPTRSGAARVSITRTDPRSE